MPDLERNDAIQPQVRNVFDPELILSRLEGDTRFVVEVIELYLEDYPAMAREIRGAVADHDARRLESSAHRLRGAIGYLTLSTAYATAGLLEEMGRDGRWDDASQASASLERDLDQLAEILRQFVADAMVT